MSNELIKATKFTKLVLFCDNEFKKTKSRIAWDIGFAANAILSEILAKLGINPVGNGIIR